jgi:hypothetical protein
LPDFLFCRLTFFVQAKRRKIFLIFFKKKMIPSKIFYNKNYFTSKQTEHKNTHKSKLKESPPS